MNVTTEEGDLALSLTTSFAVPDGQAATLRGAIHDARRFDAVRLVVAADSAARLERDGTPNDERNPRFRVDELRVDGQLLYGADWPHRSFDDDFFEDFPERDGISISGPWVGLPALAEPGSEVTVEVTNRSGAPAAFSATLYLRVARSASEGCPSISTFQCNHCRRLFCSSCARRSTCDSSNVGIKTIGHWYCDAPACAEAGAVVSGSSVKATLAQYAGRPHPGRWVTESHLDQLILLGPTEEMRETARVARDESAPRWRALDARDRCARLLGLDEEARP